MANTKQVEIEARVPWTWAEALPEAEAACFAATFLNPVSGLHLSQLMDGYEPNEQGGQTAMVVVRIGGVEAVSWPFLSRLCQALASQGTLRRALAMDLDDQGDWASIEVDETEAR